MADRSPADVVVIGPMPPGNGGAIRTFEEFRGGLDACGVRWAVVDTAPGSVPARFGARYRELVALRILVCALRNIRARTPVVWFISAGMVRTLGWLVPVLARAAPVSLVAFGGLLGESLCDDAGRPVDRRVRWLGAARAVFVESDLTAGESTRAGLGNVEVIGATRSTHGIAARTTVVPRAGRPLRLVHAGRIYAEKGLHDLARLCACSAGSVSIDLIGNAEDGHEADVRSVVADTPGLSLLGPQSPRGVLEALRDADFSILLSSYPGEGISGLVTESLLVGTPSIVSAFRALPEIVRDGENGLVVQAAGIGWDVEGLSDRLASLDDDALALLRLGAVRDASRFSPVRQARRLLTSLGRDVVEPVSC